jgi:hypothetical protein
VVSFRIRMQLRGGCAAVWLPFLLRHRPLRMLACDVLRHRRCTRAAASSARSTTSRRRLRTWRAAPRSAQGACRAPRATAMLVFSCCQYLRHGAVVGNRRRTRSSPWATRSSPRS